MRHVLGVDGCGAGWVVAARLAGTGETSVVITDSFRSILDGVGATADMIIIDMPIGLADFPQGRRCEKEARARIGARRSSVFPSPQRAMLAMNSYDAANDYGKRQGSGITKQAWAITPKIREIDKIITPGLQSRIGEGHPELAFARLAGRPCQHPKRTIDGQKERRDLLIGAGFNEIDRLHVDLRLRHPRKREFAADDFYDACALALTAEARLAGAAWRLGDGACDSRGLLMEIWG